MRSFHPGATPPDHDTLVSMTLEELLEHALSELQRITVGGHVKYGMVSGPISNRDPATVERNLRHFHLAIKGIQEKGFPIFSQMLYEPGLLALREKWQAERGEQYFQPMLDKFYKPILQSGMIGQLWQIPGWINSKGAVREHQICCSLQIPTTVIKLEEFQKWINPEMAE